MRNFAQSRLARALIAVSAAALTVAGTSGLAVAKDDDRGGNTIKAVDTGHGARPMRFVGAPGERNPGVYNFTFTNTDMEPHFIAWIKLSDEDASRAEIIAELNKIHGPQGVGPGKFFTALAGAPVVAGPGQSVPATEHFTSGRYVYFCPFHTTLTAPPHYQLGMLGTTEVEGN